MSIATEILRHAEDEPRLRACSVLERLAILEDRRRVTLFQRARPSLALALAFTLGVFRPLCRDEDVCAYREDMQVLAGGDLSDVEGWLRESGFDDEASAAWFERAETVSLTSRWNRRWGASTHCASLT